MLISWVSTVDNNKLSYDISQNVCQTTRNEGFWQPNCAFQNAVNDVCKIPQKSCFFQFPVFIPESWNRKILISIMFYWSKRFSCDIYMYNLAPIIVICEVPHYGKMTMNSHVKPTSILLDKNILLMYRYSWFWDQKNISIIHLMKKNT